MVDNPCIKHVDGFHEYLFKLQSLKEDSLQYQVIGVTLRALSATQASTTPSAQCAFVYVSCGLSGPRVSQQNVICVDSDMHQSVSERRPHPDAEGYGSHPACVPLYCSHYGKHIISYAVHDIT